MDELLSIGEFSTRCGLSPKMLRSYAAVGLLVPVAVDGSSGYRFYSGSQLQRARVIGLLRRAGISVNNILVFFRYPDVAQFDRWEREIDAELSSRHHALAQARAVLALEEASAESPTAPPKIGRLVTYKFLAGSATHRGGRETNQDAALVSGELFAVADGLGGLQDGEVASRLALDALEAAFVVGRTRSGLVSACREANQAVWDQATLDGHDPTMGTTVAAVGIVSDGEPAVVHVGDSRLYRYRNGHLEQLTNDHSITADLIRAGEITPVEAQTHPQRHILTRALGVAPEVEVDTDDVSCEPGDRLMLCTDGLFKALTPDELEAVLASRDEAQQVADHLITIAVDRRAEDNATAVIIDVR